MDGVPRWDHVMPPSPRPAGPFPESRYLLLRSRWKEGVHRDLDAIRPDPTGTPVSPCYDTAESGDASDSPGSVRWRSDARDLMGSARPGSNPGDCDTKPWGPLHSFHETKEDPARAAVMSERLRSQTRTSRVSVETKTDEHGSTRQTFRFCRSHTALVDTRRGRNRPTRHERGEWPSRKPGAMGDEKRWDALDLHASGNLHSKRSSKWQLDAEMIPASTRSPKTSLFHRGAIAVARAPHLVGSLTRKPIGFPFALPLLLRV